MCFYHISPNATFTTTSTNTVPLTALLVEPHQLPHHPSFVIICCHVSPAVQFRLVYLILTVLVTGSDFFDLKSISVLLKTFPIIPKLSSYIYFYWFILIFTGSQLTWIGSLIFWVFWTRLKPLYFPNLP